MKATKTASNIPKTSDERYKIFELKQKIRAMDKQILELQRANDILRDELESRAMFS